MKPKFTLFVFLLSSVEATFLLADEPKVEKSSSVKVSVDLVSSYIWRGSLATTSPTPNLQPTLAFIRGNFEVGVWGSTDFIGSSKEVDPYILLTLNHLKFGFTDYNWNFTNATYFDYKNSSTDHRIEGTIGFTGTKAFPVSISWNTIIYGLDKKYDDTTKQAFSTYIEFIYTKGAENFFIGFTPWSGYYNNYGITTFNSERFRKSFSIVNVGLTVTKEVKINESFSFPLKATLAINPSASCSRKDNIHLVVGLTF